jgi:deoxyribose-phosphate aldolase
MLTQDFFYKRFYALQIGPQFSDKGLVEFIEACKNHERYIAGVAVNLHQISQTGSLLADSGINLVGPVAYPLGNLPTELKVVQIEEAVRDGADEIHAVMKVEALLCGDYESARKDAQAMIEACRKIKFKALISNAPYLTEDQALEAARICMDLGAAYITTSGFGLNTEIDDVQKIRKALGDEIQIISSGGCRTAEQAISHLKVGGNKIATGTPFKMLEELEGLMALQAIK